MASAGTRFTEKTVPATGFVVGIFCPDGKTHALMLYHKIGPNTVRYKTTGNVHGSWAEADAIRTGVLQRRPDLAPRLFVLNLADGPWSCRAAKERKKRDRPGVRPSAATAR